MYRLSKRAAAPVVAFLVAIILLSSMSASIMLVSEEYRRGSVENVEQVEEVSETLRENVKVTLLSLSGDAVTLQINNTGDVPVRLTKVLLKGDDGSLITASLPSPVEIPAGGFKTVTATMPEGSISGVGVMSERGNVFAASTSTVVFAQTGLPSGTGWSVTFNGETKSTTGDSIIFEDVEPGIYGWSVSSPINLGGDTRCVASPSSGTIDVPNQTAVAITYSAQYYLSMSASPSGGGSVSPGSGWYDEGSTVTISAVPNSGYRFGGWHGSGPGSYTGGENPVTIRMNGPVNETAVFVEQGSVTFTASGLSGDASGTVLVVDGVGYTYADLPLTFTWDVGSSHSFEWKTPLDAGADKRYVWTSTSELSNKRSDTITVPSGGGSIVASYKTQYKLTISVSPPGAGSTDPAEGEYWHDGGASVSVSASPSANYRFDHWMLDGSSAGSDNPVTITMTKSHSLVAVFVETGAVTFTASGLGVDAQGTVLTVDGVDYSRSDLPLTFVWDVGSSHSFEWHTPVPAGSGKRYVWTSTSGLSMARSGSITVPSGGGSVSASYKTQYYLTVSSAHGSPNPTSGWFDSGTSITASVNSPVYNGDTRYICTGWTGTGSVPASGSDTSVTFTISEPSSITWQWKTQHKLTMQVNPAGGGSTTPSAGSHWYDEGATVSISASPSAGYRFDRWVGEGSGSYSGTSSTATVTVNEPITETAEFVEVGTVKFSASGMSLDASGTVLIVDGKSYEYAGLPVTFTWNVGSSHTFEWKTPVSAGSGKRYVWISTTGLSNERSGTITVPSGGGSVAASYKTQYKLSITVSPSGAGSTSPAEGEYWYDHGSAVSVRASPAASYRFECWLLDDSTFVTSNPITVSMDSAHTLKALFVETATITFSAGGLSSDASGVVLKVDGIEYAYADLPISFTWDVGSTHSYEWISPINAGSGKRYVWASCSGSSTGRSDSITVPSGGGSIVASYKTQYYLTVASAHDSPSPSSGWYDAGTAIRASVSSPVNGGSGIRYVCTGWTGSGSVPSSGTGTSVTFTIDRPSSITWNWKTQYYLTMQANPSDGGSLSPGSGWHDAGSKVTIKASPSPGYRFGEWRGYGSGSYTGTSESATITMNEPITETAYFIKTGTVTFSANGMGSDAAEPILTVDGVRYTYSDLPVSFTWDAGTTHTFEWITPVSAGSGKRYVWTSTSGLSSKRSGSITVPNNGGTVTASYKTQYLLTVQSGSGGTTDPSPESYWYDSGEKVDVTAKPNAGYSLDYWILDGRRIHSENPYTVTMTSAHTIKAYFKKNSYQVTFDAEGVDDDASGTVLVVDGVSYAIKDLPKTFTWTYGSSHSFEWKTPVPAGSGKRYIWTSTSGLSTSRKGAITVPIDGGEVKASYKTQYRLKIEVSPVGSEDVSTNPPPGIYWYDSGSSVRVTAVNNAPFKVTLKADTASSGITTSLSKTSGKPKYTSTLTVKVGDAASPGTHRISVTGFEYGWKFREWILDGKSSGTGSSITVAMNAPHTVEADFYMPHAKVTLSQSSLTISRGGSARVTVTVEEAGSSRQNTKILTVTVPPKVTVIVRDYRGTPLSDVTVTVGGVSKKTDSNGRAIFTVQAGKYKIAVPESIRAGIYQKKFYKWSDGKTGNSRTETISGDASFTAIYKARAFFGGFSAAEIPPSVSPGPITSPGFAADGTVYYGDPQPLEGVKVKVVFHLVSWLFGRKTVSATAVTDRSGKFHAKYSSLADALAYDLDYAEAYVISPGYTSETATYGSKRTFYTVRFIQTGLPEGTEWKVNLDGHEKSGTGGTITFYAPDGTYSYTIESPIYEGASVRYVASPSHGTIRVNGLARDIYIKFSKEYLLTISVSGLGSTEPAEGSHWIKAGSKVTIKAHLAGNYRFDRWTGSGRGSYTGTKNPATITVNEPITETAVFVKQATVTFKSNMGSDASGAVLVVDGKSYSIMDLPKTFRWDVGSKHSFEWKSIVSAGSGKRYVWTSTSGLSSKRSGTITVPSNGGSITSYYKTQYALTVTVSPSGAGTTSPSGTRWCDAGSRITVSASTSSSFKVSLSASGLPRGASASFNPSSETPPFTATLRISTSSWTPSGSYSIIVEGSRSGYVFDCWKLDGKQVGTRSSYRVCMDAPHRLTAVFTQPKIRVDAEASTVKVEPGKSTSVSVVVSQHNPEDRSDTFTLKVLKYVTITIRVQDVHRGTPIPGVTVSVDGESKRTDRYGRASFTVLEGKHTISVPESASAGSRGALPFWKWSDGSTFRSRTVTVSSSQTYTAIYKNLLCLSSVDAGHDGSNFWAKVYVRVKGYGGSSAYASYANVKATWKVWYWYRWWPDYISGSGTADWTGYKYLSRRISGWGITGVECIIEADAPGYVMARWSRTVYSSSWVEVKFSASGLSGVSGTVLVVDGKGYRLSDLPKTFTWEVGSRHSYSWTSTFSINSHTRYAWKSTSGISSSRSATITVPNRGGSIKATYSRQYYLRMEAGAGGSVSPSSGWHDEGSTVTIRATPNSGYVFDKWIGSGRGSYTGKSRTATIQVKGPITEKAIFKIPTYTVKFMCSGKPSGESWTVIFNGEVKSSRGSTIYFYNVKRGTYSFLIGTIYDGSGVRYRPTPISGTIKVPGVTSKHVTFKKQYRLYISRNVAGGYTVPSLGEHWYNAGSRVTIEAHAYGGYLFQKWVGSGSGSYTGTSSSRTITMNAPIVETAFFREEPKLFTVTFYRSGLPGGKLWTVKFNGQTKSTTGSCISFSKVKPGHYIWRAYTVSGGFGIRYRPSPSTGTINVQGNVKETICFVEEHRLLMVSSSGGYTSPSAGEHWYRPGTIVWISATPKSSSNPSEYYYTFHRWIGSGRGSYSGTQRTAAVRVDEPVTEKPVFAYHYKVAVWHPGYYTYEGTWVPGHYEKKWVPGHWEKRTRTETYWVKVPHTRWVRKPVYGYRKEPVYGYRWVRKPVCGWYWTYDYWSGWHWEYSCHYEWVMEKYVKYYRTVRYVKDYRWVRETYYTWERRTRTVTYWEWIPGHYEQEWIPGHYEWKKVWHPGYYTYEWQVKYV